MNMMIKSEAEPILIGTDQEIEEWDVVEFIDKLWNTFPPMMPLWEVNMAKYEFIGKVLAYINRNNIRENIKTIITNFYWVYLGSQTGAFMPMPVFQEKIRIKMR